MVEDTYNIEGEFTLDEFLIDQELMYLREKYPEFLILAIPKSLSMEEFFDGRYQ